MPESTKDRYARLLGERAELTKQIRQAKAEINEEKTAAAIAELERGLAKEKTL